MNVLFVCTGNICRSPTAERLALAEAARLELPSFTAHSAGTRAVIGHDLHEEAARVVERLGGDTTRFAARQLSSKIAAPADLILTMTRSHRDAVLEVIPYKLNATFTMREAYLLVTELGASAVGELAAARPRLTSISDGALDIPDPIGQSAEVFLEVGTQISGLLGPILGLCRDR
ncbi:low molecular weight phosphatase family protein [Mycolicibacterium vaccae]|uniref:arsenate reductase/protein-tyrosine-phosphatase family protein n=1 Tax=Mycolicibacterium vaccae TaxID=1810 RepID=UPI003CED1D7E